MNRSRRSIDTDAKKYYAWNMMPIKNALNEKQGLIWNNKDKIEQY